MAPRQYEWGEVVEEGREEGARGEEQAVGVKSHGERDEHQRPQGAIMLESCSQVAKEL
jgi:hypothetical protein